MEGDELIASVYRKIEREKALITAATNMRQSTNNPLVQQRVDANIRDGRKNIAYLEEKMKELQLRQMEREGSSPTDKRLPPNPEDGPAPPPKDHSGYDDSSAQYPQPGGGNMPSGAPFKDPRPFAPVPKARPNYTKLGKLVQVDAHYLGDSLACTRIHEAHAMIDSRLDQIRYTVPWPEDPAHVIPARVQAKCGEAI
ncbi:hypothetical protein BJX61DRAFT_85696 [Aspergillus egyptiacus]|nr:hypothetical protein BJX61DRAFT_85696 [Aspergillus egyptiacus]